MINAADRINGRLPFRHDSGDDRARAMPVAAAVAWALGFCGGVSGVESGLAFCLRSVAVVRGVQDVFAE